MNLQPDTQKRKPYTTPRLEGVPLASEEDRANYKNGNSSILRCRAVFWSEDLPLRRHALPVQQRTSTDAL